MAPRSAQNGTAGPSRVADMRVKWMLRWVLDGRFHEAALRNKRGVESPQWAEAVWKPGGHSLLGRNFSQRADIGSDWSHGAVLMPPRASEQTWRTPPWITASICQDYPGIAAISPLIPTRATMRLML